MVEHKQRPEEKKIRRFSIPYATMPYQSLVTLLNVTTLPEQVYDLMIKIKNQLETVEKQVKQNVENKVLFLE